MYLTNLLTASKQVGQNAKYQYMLTLVCRCCGCQVLANKPRKKCHGVLSRIGGASLSNTTCLEQQIRAAVVMASPLPCCGVMILFRPSVNSNVVMVSPLPSCGVMVLFRRSVNSNELQCPFERRIRERLFVCRRLCCFDNNLIPGTWHGSCVSVFSILPRRRTQ